MADRPPLDPVALTEMALGYAARYAATRVKVARYLANKLRERGWAGADAPPIDALLDRLEAMGAVDDRAWGEAKAGALERRGYGAGRVRGALAAAGVAAETRGEIAAGVDGPVAALAYARRRRLGRFAATPRDADQARRDLGAMLRAGHGFADAKAALGGGVADEDDPADD